MVETLTEQGSRRPNRPDDHLHEVDLEPQEDTGSEGSHQKGRLSNPTQRRLSPADIDELVDAYQAGATITQLAASFGAHRTTIAAHLDRRQTPRHHERTEWDDDALREAADLYATGLSLADIAHQHGIDAQTVANRFRRAGVPLRPRRGWSPRRHFGDERG